MKRKYLTAALVASGVIAAGTAGAVNWNPGSWFKTQAVASQAAGGTNAEMTTAAAGTAPAVAPVAAPNYRAIVQRFGPAVVGINTSGTSRTAARNLPPELGDNPFFRRFGAPDADVPVRGQGSGFIVSSDGLILTNAHVVADVDEVTVKLSDRREFKAKVLGSDKETDVAVLRIDAKNLPVVTLGDPGKLAVGDYVLAIGSPFGFEQSATAGIVSAKARSLPGDGHVPFIQTDVAVNPGNSGGPLFDGTGNVIGINSQIYSQTGGYEGVSFAIPIDVALHVKDQIVATGKVSHPRLGVTVQEVNQGLADSFKLGQPAGALVSSVQPGSAAAKAGVEPGDVILQFNGRPIDRSGDLPAMLSFAKPGDKANLQVWRGGKKIDLAATLTAAKEVVASNDAGNGASQGKLGVAVRPLTPEEARAGHLRGGVVVEQIAGAAERAGIEQGDIILSVNGVQVDSVDKLRSMIDKAGKQVALLIQRGEDKIFVPVRVG
ncbi:Do family serine endopeptidase [Noviherbaspirillum galbum]|nr:Do family serine endopeptidase [Noviherbaspirillum galbum]